MLVFCNLGWAEGARTTGRDFLHGFQVDFRELNPISIKKWNKSFYWRQRSKSWGWIREEYLNKPINTIYTKLSNHVFAIKRHAKIKIFWKTFGGQTKIGKLDVLFWEVLMDDRVQSCGVHLQKIRLVGKRCWWLWLWLWLLMIDICFLSYVVSSFGFKCVVNWLFGWLSG